MNKETLYHLGFDPTQITGKYAIIPGDPGRVESIAECFENPRHICQNREYNVWHAFAGDVPVIICSTGIGGPSAAIAVEELHMAGVRNFIRVGTCGGMQLDITSGDLIVAESAVRQEGTSLHYAPAEYPATASFEITSALVNSAKELGAPVHIGVVQSKDSFYGQHSPERMPVADELLYKWNAFKQLGVLASEMECAAIYTVAASLGDRAGCVLHVVWNQERASAGLDNPEIHDTLLSVKCAAKAVYMLVKSEK